MIRTSIILPPALHKELEFASRQEGKSLTQLVRELLDQAMHAKQQAQHKQMYRELRNLEGFIKDPVTDASTTIDEVLYGENGAWRGSGTKDEQ